VHAWTDTTPLCLIQHEPDTQDLEPNALACDGVLRADTPTLLLRLVDGCLVSGVTTPCLGWLTAPLAQEQQQALLVIWDHASWHLSRDVRTWITTHNRRVKREGGCRLGRCQLPTNSPWLNRIEPK
jgi:hypothetical protein